jgi:hypothetical protein
MSFSPTTESATAIFGLGLALPQGVDEKWTLVLYNSENSVDGVRFSNSIAIVD